MSKITFRADDDLVERLEGLDTSKSEVMRDALRTYLDRAERESSDADRSGATGTIDAALAAYVDELVTERVDELLATRLGERRTPPRDVNVNLTVEGAKTVENGVNAGESADGASEARKTEADEDRTAAESRTDACEKCGEEVSDEHVYCPNCGEKANHRVFCECGDELRSDWAFCPGCGRRTSAADVLERP
ncbi:double zinc ribbon domain-containing protein [Halopelagius longus]|uniref:Ribbon-helix-helix protein, copG family n=1 Tax=Halopelagius longus TaxID=1236180 RepID=A0A1H1DKL4_9EURY|nr:zinc ribbon domain-containing protein [Halopelagius longus]RDI71361.1 zinc-ribbon domain-containing protein [Halopelagius longus]SDQ76728.1 Ribbon-helix-helix protein, copG family [Halopelagius longus]